jgi:hypothetical protein
MMAQSGHLRGIFVSGVRCGKNHEIAAPFGYCL